MYQHLYVCIDISSVLKKILLKILCCDIYNTEEVFRVSVLYLNFASCYKPEDKHVCSSKIIKDFCQTE